MGLVNTNDSACNWWSTLGSADVPGQSGWYDVPSKSKSVKMQPPIWTSSDASGLKQLLSSSSFFLSPTPGFTQVPCGLARLQYSKWPISSENATLYEWAAQGTRVCSFDV